MRLTVSIMALNAASFPTQKEKPLNSSGISVLSILYLPICFTTFLLPFGAYFAPVFGSK